MVNTPSAGAGVGEDSGSAASVTKSGISGIAGNTDVRSNDAETGIKPIFDADKVQKEIDAQIQITQEFGQRASRAVGEYASSKMREANSLRDQAGKEPNPDKRAALLADAQALEDQWGANGTLRLAAHTVIGGLTGGSHGGVAGAATALMSIVVSPRSSRTLLGRLPSTTLDELSNAPGIDHAPNSNNRFTRNKHQRSLRADPATAKKT